MHYRGEKNRGKFSILFSGGGLHHVGCPEKTLLDPIKFHRENLQWYSVSIQLCRHPPNSRRQVQADQYDSASPQICIILVGDQGM